MTDPSQKRSAQAYWKANLRLVGYCLSIWFVVSYGFGILLVEQMNKIQFFGFKLGFWFAQQGSIYVFLILIFFYAWRMNVFPLTVEASGSRSKTAMICVGAGSTTLSGTGDNDVTRIGSVAGKRSSMAPSLIH